MTIPCPPPPPLSSRQAAKAAKAAAAPAKTAKEADGPALEDDSTEITDPTGEGDWGAGWGRGLVVGTAVVGLVAGREVRAWERCHFGGGMAGRGPKQAPRAAQRVRARERVQ